MRQFDVDIFVKHKSRDYTGRYPVFLRYTFTPGTVHDFFTPIRMEIFTYGY